MFQLPQAPTRRSTTIETKQEKSVIDVMIQGIANAEGKAVRATVTIQGNASDLEDLARALTDAATGSGPSLLISASTGGIETRFVIDRLGAPIKGN